MAGTTSHYGFPYDTSTDQVPTFPTRLKNLADAVDTQLFNGLANKANYKYQATAPTSPATGDLWIDTDDNKAYVWSGTAWVNFSSVGRATYSATTGSPSIVSAGGKTRLKWTGSGSITIDKAGLIDCLIVGAGGGGGGGGGSGGGGGGAGAYLLSTIYLAEGTHTVTVGAGGAVNKSGNASLVGNVISPGGGAGGNEHANTYNGDNGGSGGGGYTASGSGGTGISGVGNNGGAGGAAPNQGGGGGGAGEAGNTDAAGEGGDGLASNLADGSTNVDYCGGGGGGSNTVTKAGGTGGGGQTGSAGSANTGGGGGGTYSGSPGAGGSGVVILAFG